jgi:hypothetical protein
LTKYYFMDENAFRPTVGSAMQIKPALTFGGDDDEMATTEPDAVVHWCGRVDRAARCIGGIGRGHEF